MKLLSKDIIRTIPALVVLTFLFLPFGVGAAEQNLFALYPLEVEGEIHDFVSGDFDGDQLADIVLVYSPQADLRMRYLGLHLQKKSGGFSPRADYLVELGRSSGHINAEDISGDGRSDIVIADAEGISLLRFTPGTGFSTGPSRIISQPTLYSIPLIEGIMVDPFLYDLVGDPGLEILVPTSKGYYIYERGDNGNFQILAQLAVPIACRNSEREIGHFRQSGPSHLKICFPQITVADGNLDGRKDLYFLWDRKLCAFFQDSTGNYSQSPDWEISLLSGHEGTFLQGRVIDCNGDNRPDLLVSATSGGITGTETKLRCYMAGAGGRIGPVPVKEITLSDSHCNLLVDDFNRDGQIDMAIPAVELGAIAATKMLLMKKADLHLLIYPFSNGLPPDEPSQRMSYEFRFNFSESVPDRELAIDWSADLSGDGLPDMVFCGGNGKLQFFWGRGRDYLTKKPDLEVTLDHAAEIHPVRLGNGKLSDLVVEHNLTGKFDRITVLMNLNNKP